MSALIPHDGVIPCGHAGLWEWSERVMSMWRRGPYPEPLKRGTTTDIGGAGVRKRRCSTAWHRAEEVTGVELIAEMWVPDCVALDEIELYGELIIAASASERPLTRFEIDAVLGISREVPA